MKKLTALRLLGGTPSKAAARLRCSRAAVSKWPNEGPLPRPVADRVLAEVVRSIARQRLEQPELPGVEVLDSLAPIDPDALAL
jgi:hypothetical protein